MKFLAIALMVAGCGSSGPSDTDIQTAIAETEAVKPTVTFTPRPIATATLMSTNTPTPTEAFCAKNDVSEYFDAILPLIEEFIEDSSAVGEILDIIAIPVPGETEEELNERIATIIKPFYDRAEQRQTKMELLDPPNCADQMQLKNIEAFQLMTLAFQQVHVGEYDEAVETAQAYSRALNEATDLVAEVGNQIEY